MVMLEIRTEASFLHGVVQTTEESTARAHVPPLQPQSPHRHPLRNASLLALAPGKARKGHTRLWCHCFGPGLSIQAAVPRAVRTMAPFLNQGFQASKAHP